jgi:ABC-type branched-subunit amino acid transport system substrate-binding protein
VLGNNIGIEAGTEADIKTVEQLSSVGAVVKVLRQPSPDLLAQTLRTQSFHIAVFTGHSRSEPNGSIGWLELNDNPDVTMARVTVDHLRENLMGTVQRGLQLCIFNSCDGLGLSNQFVQELRLPVAIIMREPVPDQVAVRFLQAFFEHFSIQNHSLFKAFQEARLELEGFVRFPGVTWLPAIYTSSLSEPPSWNELRGDSEVQRLPFLPAPVAIPELPPVAEKTPELAPELVPEFAPEKTLESVVSTLKPASMSTRRLPAKLAFSSSRHWKKWAWVGGAIAIASVAIWIIGFKPEKNHQSGLIPNPSPSPSPTVPLPVGSLISDGNQVLITEPSLISQLGLATQAEKEAGVTLLKNVKTASVKTAPDYTQAIAYFQTLRARRKADPEVLVYLNNAQAQQRHRQTKTPLYTIAAIVPLNVDPGIHILRGVAQAQADAISSGINLQVVIANDGNHANRGAVMASELGKRPEILAVIGHYTSAVAHAALKSYQSAGLVIISPSASSSRFATEQQDGKNPIFFRTVSSTLDEAKALARFAKQQSAKQGKVNPKVAVFYVAGEEYTESLLDQFRIAVREEGGEMVANPINFLDEDWRDKANSAMEKADFLALFPDGQTNNSQALQEAQKLIARAPKRFLMLGAHSLLLREVAETLGETATCRLFIAAQWLPQDGDPASEAARKMWGGDVNYRTVFAHDAVKAVQRAIANGGRDRAKLRALLPQVKARGITGDIQFKPDGDRASIPFTRTFITVGKDQTGHYKYLSLDAANCR